MAEWYGGVSDYGYSWGSGTTQAYLSASVEIISETVARISVHGSTACISGGINSYGVHTQCGAGDSSADGSGVYGGNNVWVGQVDGSWDFDRKQSDYDVRVFCSYNGAEVNGYGAAGNSGTVDGTLTIPARPYTAAGMPSASASKTTVANNEEIALTWVKSTTQGNANFDHFEVTDGLGGVVYSGTSTSVKSTPGAILEKYGKDNYYNQISVTDKQKGWVYYAVWEVHEWYGSYPSSPICWVGVEVKTSVVIDPKKYIPLGALLEIKKYIDGKMSGYFPGGLYLSVDATSPASLYGGTWERIKDVFLLAAGDTYKVGDKGGSAAHTLTVDEMPNISLQYKDYFSADQGTEHKLVSYDSEDPSSESSAHTKSIGGGNSFSVMPPYLTVYVWKRLS